jgi:hypothetical protein
MMLHALVASLGFVPMALSHSPGSEVQRPLAKVALPVVLPWFAGWPKAPKLVVEDELTAASTHARVYSNGIEAGQP